MVTAVIVALLLCFAKCLDRISGDNLLDIRPKMRKYERSLRIYIYIYERNDHVHTYTLNPKQYSHSRYQYNSIVYVMRGKRILINIARTHTHIETKTDLLQLIMVV